MSIIQPTQSAPTVNDVVNQIKSGNMQIYRFLKMQHTQSFNNVWNNPTYTPQEIVDAFGTDAATLFTLSWQIQQILQAADPGYVMLIPPVPVVINPDGTVTLGQ